MAIRSLKSGSFSRTAQVGNAIILPGDYESIATTTVGSGGTSSISFTSIPSTFTHLQLRYLSRGSTDNVFYMRFNSDTAGNYSDHALYGAGTSAAAFSDVTSSRIGQFRQSDSATTTLMGNGVVDILDYANTNKYKTVRALSGTDFNGSGIIMLTSGGWRNTNAISTITLNVDGGNFAQYSHFALYGIRG